jgi:23S rRNA (adenine1618-N6)-methyltransferase
MTTKKTLHKRNPHNERYDFEALCKTSPELEEYVGVNEHDNVSIDFANPNSVMALNKALLSHFYQIKNWGIPSNYLCPAIPGRADYIHHIADILAESNDGKIPKGKTVKGLDVGVGASCIFPIIGHQVYGWSFVGSEIDKSSIQSAELIINSNNALKGSLSCRHQPDPRNILKGIINDGEKFDFTICNPPFHKSHAESTAGSLRKIKNLQKKVVKDPVLNFAGQSNELWCAGGEVAFIISMIKQSENFAKNCKWFTTLVSKKNHLPVIYKSLAKSGAIQVRTIEMKQGQKISRFIAWSYTIAPKKK